MSYLDARNSPDPRSMAAVVAIHAAVGVALIYGLTVSGIIAEKEGPIVAIPFRDPPPPEPPKPQQQREPRDPVIFAPQPKLPPLDPVQPRLDTTDIFPTPGPVIPSGSGTLAPLPVPDPSPTFAALGAKPRNDPRNWIGTEDYRSNWLRQEWSGRAGFRLEITAEGRVADCMITSSTGHADMDEATCALIRKRARFQPGRGTDGQPVASSYSSSVIWQIPD